ncbi:MAG: hypothetical protein K8T25_08330, partial [Planctomycetia bacterium]|nr:hypothetical protein [Planctomycetia bacterium]
MADRVASHLKVYNDAALLAAGHNLDDGPAEIDTLCTALSDATGWPIRLAAGPAPSQDPLLQWSAPVNLGVGTAPGHLRMD